jgi:hypothetical protein
MARCLVVFVLCLGVIVIAPRVGDAQSSVSMSGSPAALQILGAAGGAGGLPAPAVDAATTYTVKVQNKAVKKITVQLSSNMPPGVTLTISLAPPIGASSVPVSLSTTVTDAVTNITNKQAQTLAITYTLNATVAAGVVGSQSRTVTFTLINFP